MQETQETWVWSLGQEDPLQEEMATHSSIIASRTPWTELCSRLESMGSQRIGRNWECMHALDPKKRLSSTSFIFNYLNSHYVLLLAKTTIYLLDKNLWKNLFLCVLWTEKHLVLKNISTKDLHKIARISKWLLLVHKEATYFDFFQIKFFHQYPSLHSREINSLNLQASI